MDQAATFKTGASSASSTSSASASRRNSFAYLEKPSDDTPGLSAFSSFTSLKGLSSSRVALLPMPVVTTAANSALEVARSSFRWLPTSHITLPLHSPLPPFSPGVPPSPRLRVLFGNCFYRRVIVWGAALLSFVILSLLVRQHQSSDGFQLQNPWQQPSPELPDPEGTWLNYTLLDGYYHGIRTIVPIAQNIPQFPTLEDQKAGRLEMAKSDNETEEGVKQKRGAVPADVAEAMEEAMEESVASMPSAAPAVLATAPKPSPFRPQPDYNSSEYRSKYYPVQRCFLDAAGKVPVPDLWAYNGVPQGQPKPLYGSHEVLGMRDDVCFDRFGRYGPYGMGYSKEEGGIGQGLDTEKEDFEAVWSTPSGKIDYSNIDWADAQQRCYEANKERFVAVPETVHGSTLFPKTKSDKQVSEAEFNRSEQEAAASGLQKLERTAIVVRCYAGFKWTPHAVLNFRALVSELALQSGGEYDVHILLHVRDEGLPVWADAETSEKFIADNIPAEFRGLVSTWSVAQMRVLYPSLFGQPVFENPSDADIHGVYRSPHLALQHFAQIHPEYAHYWNWEMDMRFLGSYYEFFDRLDKWSAAQPRRRLWDRSAKYYIPALHGSWDDFTALVDAEAHEAGRPSILGEVYFAGRTTTRDEERGISPLPAQGCKGATLSRYDRQFPDVNKTTAEGEKPTRHFFADRNNNYTNIPQQCGVGEPADLITLNPMFDSEDSGWVFANDVTGYNLDFAIPPRRTAIITASRLSRRLLFAMHEESWRLHHGMFAEMFPPSIALHRGFKAAYAPHPVYSDRHWPLAAVERAFNAGPDHSAGASRNSPFDQSNEHFHRGMSWYYNADFAGRLWRRWLGYLQPLDDKAAPKPVPKADDNSFDSKLSGLGGGPGEEMRESGRMCMRSVLVHPIKFESLEEILP